MNIFNLVDLSKMGEPDPEFGQKYWGETDDGRYVMFSKNQEIVAPVTIAAEGTVSKPGKKKPYLWLTKVSVAEKTPELPVDEPEEPKNPGGGGGGSPHPAIDERFNRIDSALQELQSGMDKLLGSDYDPQN